jgi:nucleotide-binding universal stress UspA family protein
MYRVLVPVDADGDRAVAQARAVQNLPGSRSAVEVTILHVSDGDPEVSPAQLPAGRAAVESLREAGVAVETAARSGDPAVEIVQVAREVDADLVVLGGRKRSPLGSLLFGSVTQAVIADADRPVTVTGNTVRAVGDQGTA